MTQTQTKLKMPKTWRKVESANFVRFENHGDTVSGMLTERVLEGKMTFYKIRTFEGEEKKFHGTKQLDDILNQFTIPQYLKITYVDDLDTGNFPTPMKIFEVEIGEN